MALACALRSCAYVDPSRAVQQGCPHARSRAASAALSRQPPTSQKVLFVANIKSQLKRIKTNKVATERNKAVKSDVRTAIRKFRDLADAGKVDEAKDALKVA